MRKNSPKLKITLVNLDANGSVIARRGFGHPARRPGTEKIRDRILRALKHGF